MDLDQLIEYLQGLQKSNKGSYKMLSHYIELCKESNKYYVSENVALNIEDNLIVNDKDKTIIFGDYFEH